MEDSQRCGIKADTVLVLATLAFSLTSSLLTVSSFPTISFSLSGLYFSTLKKTKKHRKHEKKILLA